MCGRFTLTKSERAELEDEMGISRGSLSPGYQARFNIARPTLGFAIRQQPKSGIYDSRFTIHD